MLLAHTACSLPITTDSDVWTPSQPKHYLYAHTQSGCGVESSTSSGTLSNNLKPSLSTTHYCMLLLVVLYPQTQHCHYINIGILVFQVWLHGCLPCSLCLQECGVCLGIALFILWQALLTLLIGPCLALFLWLLLCRWGENSTLHQMSTL